MPDNCAFDPTRECNGLKAVGLLEMRVKSLENWQENSRQFHRDFYDWQRQQIARDATLDEKINQLVTNVNKLVARQEQEDQEPRQLKNNITKEVVKYVVLLVVGALLAAIGLKG